MSGGAHRWPGDELDPSRRPLGNRRNEVAMIQGLSILLGCQLAGELLARAAGLPIPGPVIGILLLLGLLAIRGRLGRAPGSGPASEDPTGGAAEGLLRHLGLLFVPAGVGIVQHLDLLAAHAGAVLAALLISTAATLIVSVLVFRAVAARFGAKDP